MQIFYQPEVVASIISFLSYVPAILWNVLVTLCQWAIPYSWYAKRVDQDIVLITGSGSGLGQKIALEYARLGSSLILWDINTQGLQETQRLVEQEHLEWLARFESAKSSELKAAKKFCLTYHVDVSDKLKVQDASRQVMLDINKDLKDHEQERYVSVLVNNAGIYYGLLLQSLTDEQIERVFKINVLAHFWTVRAFLPKMVEHQRGHIVEIASMGGIAGMLKQVDYCSTKFATVGFEESLNLELDYLGLSDKVRTTCVCPFFFSSNLFTGFNTNAGGLMTCDYVAQETVNAMRCNHSRVMLPKLYAYSLFSAKSMLPRNCYKILTKALGFAESIKEIKGRAAANA